MHSNARRWLQTMSAHFLGNRKNGPAEDNFHDQQLGTKLMHKYHNIRGLISRPRLPCRKARLCLYYTNESKFYITRVESGRLPSSRVTKYSLSCSPICDKLELSKEAVRDASLLSGLMLAGWRRHPDSREHSTSSFRIDRHFRRLIRKFCATIENTWMHSVVVNDSGMRCNILSLRNIS